MQKLLLLLTLATVILSQPPFPVNLNYYSVARTKGFVSSVDFDFIFPAGMTATKRTAQYFDALLWATAGLSVIRFAGCLFFLFKTGAFVLFKRR